MGKHRRLLLAAIGVFVCTAAACAEAQTPQLKKAPLAEDGSLRLRIVAQPRCMFGDYDLIIADLGSSKERSVILTIEQLLGPPGAPLAAASVYGGEGGAVAGPGHELSLQMPPIPAAKLYGLFLCRDAAGSGSCAGKPAVSFMEALKPYMAPRPPDFQVTDKIYFFSFLVAAPDGVYFLDELMSDATIARLPAQLRALGVQTATDEFTKLHELVRILGSAPLRHEDGRLVIDVPRLDQERCSYKAPARK